MFPSLSYTNMPISIVLVLVHCLPTNYGNHVVLYSTIVPNIVCISLFISELHKYASSHCALLWYGKGIVYRQIIKTVVSNH